MPSEAGNPAFQRGVGGTEAPGLIPAPEFPGDEGRVAVARAAATGFALEDQSGGGGGTTLASPFTTQEFADAYSGQGTYEAFMFASDRPAIALGVQGDAFPRLVIRSDPGSGVFLGDGTFDPTAGDGVNLTITNDGLHKTSLQITPPGGASLTLTGKVTSDQDITFDANNGGPVVQSPNASYHRIKVADDGTVSSEAVV